VFLVDYFIVGLVLLNSVVPSPVVEFCHGLITGAGETHGLRILGKEFQN
jgi:hypothetical protein